MPVVDSTVLGTGNIFKRVELMLSVLNTIIKGKIKLKNEKMALVLRDF